MSHASHKHAWLAVAGVLVGACGSGDGARINSDLTPLWQQSGQTSQVDSISVRVYSDHGVLELEEVLMRITDVLDLVVTAGPARRFEVEAAYDNAGIITPTFWGERVMDIEPGVEIDLVVPVFPAGRLTGTVATNDASTIPAGTTVTATARAPRPDAPIAPELTIDLDGFSATLPTGAYDLTVRYTVGTTTYRRTDAGAAVTVVQGELTANVAIVVGPI